MSIYRRFRAWHQATKTMVYDPLTIAGQQKSDGHINNLFDEDAQKWQILMQFTGLLDCNGKEIWEGDIMRFPGAPQAMWVEYQPPAFVMRHKTPSGRKSESWSTFDLDYREPQFYEIIGNMYEHPELLQAKENNTW